LFRAQGGLSGRPGSVFLHMEIERKSLRLLALRLRPIICQNFLFFEANLSQSGSASWQFYETEKTVLQAFYALGIIE